MPAFEYEALDAKGKKQQGVLEADSPRQVRQTLRDKQLTPLQVKAAAVKPKSLQSSLWQKGASVADISLISRQLATLVAVMPIEEALQAVTEQNEKAHLRTLLARVRSKVLEGYSFADALGQYPHVFDHLFRAMVAAGEKSGHLEPVLERLADYMERREYIRSKLLQAMIYPAMLAVVAVGVISILLVAVVPKVVAQFARSGQILPTPTRILMWLSETAQAYGWIGALLVMAVIFGTRLWLKKPANRLTWDKAVLHLPLIGRVAKGLNTARFARTLSILNSSAVPLLEGMKIAGEVLSNRFAKEQLTAAAERVREGASLRSALTATKLFPPMMLHMIASGEKSGELDSMLDRAATNQDREFESHVNIALGVVQPIIVIIAASMVLFIVMAILLPILEMNNLVN